MPKSITIIIINILIIACHPDCNMGLMRCTGSSSSDCCVAFEDDQCLSNTNCTKNNFVANEQNNYTCGKSIAETSDHK